MEYLEAGLTVDQFKREYPWVPVELVHAYLRFALHAAATT